MLTTMETITSKEETTIVELRKLMKGDLPPEMYDNTSLLYKFLKARNFKVKQAEVMLRKHIEWRKKLQIDTIVTEYPVNEVARKYISASNVCFDKEGSLVKFSAIGNIDGEGLFRSANKYDVLKCCLHLLEADLKTLSEQTKKLGKPVTQCVFIFDLRDLTLAKATHKESIYHFRTGINIFQDNYPELLKWIYVINASIYFTMAFPVIKAILSSSTIKKIKVFGKSGWKEELLTKIDADVLPAFLGGKKTDPDGNPLCNTFINYAGYIPESSYLSKNIERTAKMEGMKKRLIERQSSFRVNMEVKNPGSLLKWEFETKYHDIGFRLQLEERSSTDCEAVELIPMHKIETEFKPIKGMFRCKTPGTYIITFDNTYSWFHSKEVYYRIILMDPDEHFIQ